jgi:hypothetical protein
MSDVEDVIKKLLESLVRSGDHWTGQYAITPAKGFHNIAVFLSGTLPPKSGKPIAGYVKAFCQENGWKAQVRIRPRYVAIELSRA